MSSSNRDAGEINYSELLRQLENDNILEATFHGEQTVRGELKNTITVEETDINEFVTKLPPSVGESLTASMQEREVEINSVPRGPGWGTWVFSIFPFLLFIVFWIWFLRAMQSGGNRAFQFGRSRARLISPDTPQVTFADVAGAEEAKVELEEIIEFLKDPPRFSRLGGRLPKGVLLVGPPGTGKTLLARAVAGEAGRPFFQMSGSDFVEMFVGVGASRVRDLFEQGKAHAPCIIFVDEIDAVGRHRGAGLGGGHDEREQTLNALLVEMDGFEANEGVILLAATNRPDVLDPALLRPGRFDRQVVVDLPDVKGREGILRVHAKKLPLGEDVELSLVARGTPGLSGADLSNICNEAALFAARRGVDRVSMEDFEQAKDKVMLGTERRSMVLTDAERELTAYHEAGHVVIGVKVPGLDPVHKVTIVPRGRALGLTASLPEEDRHSHTRDWLNGQLAMLFGGRVAEELVFGPEHVTTGAGNDIERATTMARRMVTRFGMSDRIGLMAVGDGEQEVFLGRELVQRREVSEYTAQQVDEEVKQILDAAHRRARGIVENNRDLLKSIAEALLDRETLDADEIQLLVDGKELPPLATDFDSDAVPEEAAGKEVKVVVKPHPGLGPADPLPSPG
ncbi:MAG: ATP-dependent metallopeptidase FtsH/Yme1/Tma family protein [Gemmatimonadetes bacterium]|nr:ATP-dependent metallopeptidase FtsH/Yme1/Tma family protein [Gemmatimonadota bacterium]MYA11486.1 ATP-dependent metallopeptidase FtsH/Yme1/Tma family protein [Gemmatimonadota bacterium]MYD12722.1 ATP-dependent metallopeptidase FtsH/Yme1/Tma family protein [Gemmatimonadota bacterium]MYE70937.1 ATP-dependent metallopeptidase FtsH/Yme1/Tma family protein [Gemmatimonadota bacterium]MYI67008.1 ATP-dependent metallopeptidase FtsH/Yme1/Tma family protein [Gemmatimonadota bacterium]